MPVRHWTGSCFSLRNVLRTKNHKNVEKKFRLEKKGMFSVAILKTSLDAGACVP
jgi:hypothetical protein